MLNGNRTERARHCFGETENATRGMIEKYLAERSIYDAKTNKRCHISLLLDSKTIQTPNLHSCAEKNMETSVYVQRRVATSAQRAATSATCGKRASKISFFESLARIQIVFLADQILVDPNERLQSIIESSHANFLEKSTFSKHLFLYFFKKFNLDMVEKDELASRQMDLMRPYLLSTRSNPYSNHRLRHGSCSHTQSENYSI